MGIYVLMYASVYLCILMSIVVDIYVRSVCTLCQVVASSTADEIPCFNLEARPSVSAGRCSPLQSSLPSSRVRSSVDRGWSMPIEERINSAHFVCSFQFILFICEVWSFSPTGQSKFAAKFKRHGRERIT